MKIMQAALLMLIYFYGVTSESKEDNLMLNYGVHIKFLDSVRVKTDYWQKFIVIPLDGLPRESSKLPPHIALNCKKNISQTNDSCDNFTLVKLVRKMEVDFMDKLYITLKRLYQIYPEIDLDNLNKSKRTMRSPLDIVGNFAHWAFGITTDKELIKLKIGLKNTIEHLKSDSNQTFKKVNEFASIINLMNSKLATVFENEMETRKTVSENIITLDQNIHNFVKMNLMVEKRMYHLIQGYNELQDQIVAYENLITGKADPFILSPELFRNISNLISKQLIDQGMTETFLIPLNPHILYGTSNGKAVRFQKKLIFIKNFPLTSWKQNFEIYEINSFKIPVLNNSTFATQIEALPKFLIISQDHTVCIKFNSKPKWSNQIFDLEHEVVHLCRNTCLSALIEDNAVNIKVFCKFYFSPFYLEQLVYRISMSSILLINVNSFIQKCNNNETIVEGCSYCIKIVMCGCSIQTTNFFIPAQISGCTEDLDDQKRYYASNIAFLNNFFDHDNVLDFVNISNMGYQSSIRLPNFTFLGNVKNDLQLNLSLITEKWKNEEPFNLNEYEKLMLDRSISSIDCIIQWSTYDYFISLGSCLGIITFSCLIVIACKTSKLYSMLTALSLLARNNANALEYTQSPIKLVYNGKSTSPGTGTYTTRLSIQDYITEYNSIITNTLLFLIIVILCIYIVKIFNMYKIKPKYFITKLYINVANINNSLNVHILLLNLPDTWSNFNYLEETGGCSVATVGYVQPQLIVSRPPKLSHKRYPAHQIGVPIVKLGLLEAAKLRKILSSTHFILPYILTGDNELISIVSQSADALPEPNCCPTYTSRPLPYSKYDEAFNMSSKDNEESFHESIALYPSIAKDKLHLKVENRTSERK